MTIKTFNLDEAVYKEFSKHCKKHGISMSRKVENFIRGEMERINSFGEIRRNAGRLSNLDFKLEVEKDTKIKKELPSPQKPEDEHPMGKYC